MMTLGHLRPNPPRTKKVLVLPRGRFQVPWTHNPPIRFWPGYACPSDIWTSLGTC
jgi:hypothetical protein